MSRHEDEVEISITIYGSDSQRWIDETDFEQSRHAEEEELSEKEKEGMIKRVLAKCTMSWTGKIELEGEVLTCSPDNAERLYNHEGLEWISQQLLAAVGNRRLLFLELPNG